MVRPPKDEEYWKRHIRPGPKPVFTKSKRYIVEQEGMKHILTISQEGEWYTVQIFLEKSLTDPTTNSQKKQWDMTAKDLNFLKDAARDFLKRFGEYTIKPI